MILQLPPCKGKGDSDDSETFSPCDRREQTVAERELLAKLLDLPPLFGYCQRAPSRYLGRGDLQAIVPARCKSWGCGNCGAWLRQRHAINHGANLVNCTEPLFVSPAPLDGWTAGQKRLHRVAASWVRVAAPEPVVIGTAALPGGKAVSVEEAVRMLRKAIDSIVYVNRGKDTRFKPIAYSRDWKPPKEPESGWAFEGFAFAYTRDTEALMAVLAEYGVKGEIRPTEGDAPSSVGWQWPADLGAAKRQQIGQRVARMSEVASIEGASLSMRLPRTSAKRTRPEASRSTVELVEKAGVPGDVRGSRPSSPLPNTIDEVGETPGGEKPIPVKTHPHHGRSDDNAQEVADVKMPHGKHAGVEMEDVPSHYLEWVVREIGDRSKIGRAAGLELDRRRLAARPIRDIPAARPCVVHGVQLDAFEAALLAQARQDGVMRIGLDVPGASRAPEAWRRLCKAEGRDARIVYDEISQGAA